MSNLRRSIQNKIENSFLTVLAYYVLDAWYLLRYWLYGTKKLSEHDIRKVEENVTFVYKSFNRQKKAKRLYYSIRRYFPNVRIIIADDSAVPLEISGAEIVYLPFNSGVSKGQIAALEKVDTPYMVRLDDDMLMVPQTHFEKLLRFLQEHKAVDLAAVTCEKPCKKSAARYLRFDMGKSMLIPVGTIIGDCIVSAKVPNCFIARTESVRKVSYDPNIRMIDHHEFFFRAAGQIVAVIDPSSFILHCHNPFDWKYRPYRSDTRGDAIYIWKKHARENYR